MQQRNQYKNIDDFLTDESFQKWVREGDQRNHWEEWTVENPERAKLVAEARLWVLAMRVPESPLSSSEITAALQASLIKIKSIEKETATLSVPLWNRIGWRSIAAVLVLGLALGWLYRRQAVSQDTLTYAELINRDADGLIEQTNNSNKPQLITLSDGSSVLLQPKSKLSYPKSFEGNERNVYLLGEGFFEISKNPKKPFYVFANEIVTKVVGTSFRIKAYTDQPNVEVVVRTGKVNVSSNQSLTQSSKASVQLLPNQAVRFVRDRLVFEKITDITQEKQIIKTVTAIEQISFEFSDVPVAQILKTIEEAYLVEIDYPQEKLKDCYLTTSLSDQPLPEKLKIICESLGSTTRYEMNGNRITILSTGCN
ncbi:FecR family protein [Runella slithyformis]|uniref:Anti-FecI sigma factor, FecR n=1 Tax=Runella slithyformis (strain ATCC 29530 / DSM 19594 / LMG 11500 / NCIMB 11436 / LSU 4) TaxID=761193 RepID=A0A7U4E8G9_RUNSL|nr:FecR family protein [Runella slithyformis]AEI51239.1 anti-FecI sigma factor, FecR [Runella slithyformis DSM 19594]